jgi:hypothetical protein
MPLLKPFVSVAVPGLVGVLSLLLSADQMMAGLPAEAVESAGGRATLKVLLLVQPAVLTLAAVFAGLLVAHKVGLRSIVVDRSQSTKADPARPNDIRAALLGGATAGAFIILGDLLFSPWTGKALAGIAVAPQDRATTLIVGILYGGVTEEIMVRWGLMSILAVLLSRLGLRRDLAIAAAIVAAAMLFALGHLPALGALVELDAALIGRTLVLNTGAGVIFGWLYWKHCLETAIAAHAVTHLVIYLARLLGLAY